MKPLRIRPTCHIKLGVWNGSCRQIVECYGLLVDLTYLAANDLSLVPSASITKHENDPIVDPHLSKCHLIGTIGSELRTYEIASARRLAESSEVINAC